MHKLNMVRVEESLKHWGNLPEQAVWLRIALLTSKRKKEREQIRKVYELVMKLTGLTEDDVVNQLSDTSIPQQQVRVYCMCGGGFLGPFAAEQPEHFYIDDRAGGLSYTRKQIYTEVEKLKSMVGDAKAPKIPFFHNCGVY